jgi:hypothetical protein
MTAELLTGAVEDLHTAGKWPHEAQDRPTEGSFSRTVRADHADELAVIDLQGNVSKGCDPRKPKTGV